MEYREFPNDSSNLLIDSSDRRFDFLTRGRKFFVLLLSGFEGSNSVQSGTSNVVVTSGEGSFSIVFVSVESDRVEVVTASVGSSDFERLTDDC